jgi:nitroreductase
MRFSQPVTAIIQKRFSCRTYKKTPVEKGVREKLSDLSSSLEPGPFGYRPRFKVTTATESDREALRRLGTYGFIKDAMGFIIGAINEPNSELEDFGYLMEKLILHTTDLGLGTCWLGGTYTKSSFSRKISAKEDELVPAVTSIGYAAEHPRMVERLARRPSRGDRRLPWRKLFFNHSFNHPLSRDDLEKYAVPLEMVRLGPSASNKQPWRILKDENAFHFYLQRTPGYQESFVMKMVTVADLQRIDMGIAMCHFEITAHELGLAGHWAFREPEIVTPDALTEYTATWVVNT